MPSAELLARMASEALPLGLRAGPPSRAFHRDVYFDTSDRILDKRGVRCRLRVSSAGARLLLVRIREGTPEPDSGGVYTTIASPDCGDDPLREATDATRVLRAIVDPERLEPRLELEIDRVERAGRHRWLMRSLFTFQYDTVTVRGGEDVEVFYEATIRRVRAGGPSLGSLARELAERYDVQPVLGDKLARARALIGARTVEALGEAVRAAREVAVIPFDRGRLGLAARDGVLTVLSGPGTGEEACREILRERFGSGQAQLRVLGTAAAIADRPTLQVWLARRIPSARESAASLEWVLLDDAVSLVGTTSIRDARTLAALHVAARSDLVREQPTWAVAGATPSAMSLYLTDEMPLPDLQSPALFHPLRRGKSRDLDGPAPEHFINRDLSELAFHGRILELAEDGRLPALERLWFLSIFWRHIDEVFMVRVGALKHVVARGKSSKSVDGLSLAQRLDAIAIRARYLVDRANHMLWTSLLPELAPDDIRILRWHEASDVEQQGLTSLFHEEIYPVLTPLAAGPGHPFPHIPSLTITVAATVQRQETGLEHFAAVPMPAGLPRFIQLPETSRFVPLEDVVIAHAASLFPGLHVKHVSWFRPTRSTEVPVDEWHSLDLLQAIEEKIERRPFGPVVRLELDAAMPRPMRELLLQEFRFEEVDHVSTLGETDVYGVERLADLGGLEQIAALPVADLHYPPFTGVTFPDDGRSMFETIGERDRLFHFPFDAFEGSVERFFLEAADDPQVLAIKVTLYRMNTESKIVEALKRAARSGKQIVAIVELKARFEEERNIEWAKTLEAAGIHVVYGLLGLKTHCKVALVVRREKRVRRYAFVGTGNLHAETARQYCDLGLLTADPDVGTDVNEIFNMLSGNTVQTDYRRLLVAPTNMLDEFLKLIDREIRHVEAGREGWMRVKLNGLADPGMIAALYRASEAGVRVDLLVRGICALRPGVPGLSENIRVISILGRFLEHVRMFHFHNAGADEYYLGSADWRPRNLRRRVEVVVPVSDPTCQAQMDDIFRTQLEDAGAWELGSDGSYTRRLGDGPGAQEILMGRAGVASS